MRGQRKEIGPLTTDRPRAGESSSVYRGENSIEQPDHAQETHASGPGCAPPVADVKLDVDQAVLVACRRDLLCLVGRPRQDKGFEALTCLGRLCPDPTHGQGCTHSFLHSRHFFSSSKFIITYRKNGHSTRGVQKSTISGKHAEVAPALGDNGQCRVSIVPQLRRLSSKPRQFEGSARNWLPYGEGSHWAATTRSESRRSRLHVARALRCPSRDAVKAYSPGLL